MLMTRLLFFSSFCADPLAFPRGASITEPLVATNHSCSLPHAPPKKNGLSFLWLNSIPSTWTCIDRDSSGWERHSSRLSCRRRLSRSGLCVCMAAAQICLGDARKRWWERNVIGKAIEHLSLHQAPCDYDPPPPPPPAPPPHLVSLWGTAVASLSFTLPFTSLFESRSPHWASILSILGSQPVKWMGGQALCLKVQIKIKKCERLSRGSRRIYVLHFFFYAQKKLQKHNPPT